MVIAKFRNWYGKYERPISSLSLIGGFVFDALTLKRVDLFWENFWVIGHLVIVGVCIVLINALEKNEGDEANPSKLHFWLTNVQQFFYGGIWSTFLVFYFRSSDIAAGWPFLLILTLAFWANESLKRHFVRLIFQVSLFYLALFSFAIFLVPVLLHQLGAETFILSGAVSLVFIALFLLLIWRVSGKQFKENKLMLFGSIAGIFALVNVLYFTNLIPPIPLSLKDAGVYYSINRNGQGDYVSLGEIRTWRDYFKLYPDFHELTGQPVFVYSAVFSPPGLNISISHEWQHQDPKTGKWVTIDQISLTVVGGRDGGFRTYSEKTFNLTPGHWRVNVLTTRGQVIGRVRFNLVMADALPKVEQKSNN
jgi:hypothetical protein